MAGAGIFGVTAALELARRGRRTVLCDPGLRGTTAADLAHHAESTDISKIVRLDYGSDRPYLEQLERALDGWRRWEHDHHEDRPLYHEIGVLFLSRGPLGPGVFEADSLAALAERGHRVERLDAAAVRRRFPAWNADRYPDGYYNPVGGYAESGRAVAWLLRRAIAAGVEVRAGVGVASLLGEGGVLGDARVTGARLTDGSVLPADDVVIAAGSWTQAILPELSEDLVANGQPVFHLVPADPALYAPERFPVFAADISTTGWYGFPLHRDGVVKIANHGPGRRVDPVADPREVNAAEEAALRTFLAETFPTLAAAPIVKRRQCVYGDSRDGHFWIARHPTRGGLTVAAGGSGHAFKFAPLVGGWIADAVEGAPNPDLARFRWRPDRRAASSEEEARAGD